MIASGEKTEEYRMIKPYWCHRLSICEMNLCWIRAEGGSCQYANILQAMNPQKYTHVRFRNGYTMGIGRTAMQFIGSGADTGGHFTTTNLPPPYERREDTAALSATINGNGTTGETVEKQGIAKASSQTRLGRESITIQPKQDARVQAKERYRIREGGTGNATADYGRVFR